MLSNIEIGNRINAVRSSRGLTLDDIASNVGVTKSTIQRYEKGTITRVKLPIIQSIAAVLGVNPNWLIGNVDDPAPTSPLSASLPGYTKEEQWIVSMYRRADEDDRTIVKAALRKYDDPYMEKEA